MAKGMQRKKEVKKPKKDTSLASSAPAIEIERAIVRVTEVIPRGKLKNKPQ